jgi:hypothetical protein
MPTPARTASRLTIWRACLRPTACLAWSRCIRCPKSGSARALYFGYPLIGLVVVADTVVRATLLLFSRQENQKEWTRVLASTYRDHIILCGLGHVGYRILERLLHWHLDVVVIEKNTESSFLLRTQQMGVPVLLMDARQEESLEAAGLHHARTLVIATNDDLANVEIALDARRLNPHIRVVLRMFDENIANKLRDAFHLEVAFLRRRRRLRWWRRRCSTWTSWAASPSMGASCLRPGLSSARSRRCAACRLRSWSIPTG